MMFLDCPAYLDAGGAVRCGLPAEVTGRFTMRSTDGPLEGASIRCPDGHYFNGPIESLTWDKHDPGIAGPGARAGRDRLQQGDYGGRSRRDFPTGPERKVRRPNGTPAYYLGRPAALWIAAIRSRRRPTAIPYLTEAAVSSG